MPYVRETRSKPKPVLAVKNSKKLWLTNWRTKPSVSLEAPNPTSPPPCSSPCSRLSATPKFQIFLLIEILPLTSSNTSVTPDCPSRASPLPFGKPKGWYPLQGSHLLPHSLQCPADTYFTQVAMHHPHLQYASGQTVAFGHYEDPLPDWRPNSL